MFLFYTSYTPPIQGVVRSRLSEKDTQYNSQEKKDMLLKGKSCFNRIFPIASLSIFFLPCFVIFGLNYVPVAFEFS